MFMLQLGHILLGGGLLRERPRQHELRFEHRTAGLDPAVEGGAHPSDRRMPDLLLDVRDDLTDIGLVPAPVQLLCRQAQLDEEVAKEVLRLRLATLFAPQP